MSISFYQKKWHNGAEYRIFSEICVKIQQLQCKLISSVDINVKAIWKVTKQAENSGRMSQETHYISATKPSWLILFRKTVAVYCENHMEHTNTLCGQNSKFHYVQAGGTYINHWSLRT
jgi:hypothetical protein